MSFGHEQSRTLNGIGESSSRGRKRTADINLYDIPNGHNWRREPTRIETASTQRRPNNIVPNPFSRLNGRKSERVFGGNPTANRTVISQPYPKSSKRARTTAGFGSLELAYPSKYSGSDMNQRSLPVRELRAIPSIVKADSSSKKSSVTSKYYQESTYDSPTSFAANPASSSSNVIMVDESESEDLGIVVSRSNSRFVSETRDEIDVIGNLPERSSRRNSLSIAERPSKSTGMVSREYAAIEGLSGVKRDSESNPRGIGTRRIAEDVSDRQKRPLLEDRTRNSRSDSSRLARRLPEDGPSTRRLNGKFASYGSSVEEIGNRPSIHASSEGAAASREIPSSPLCSPPLERAKVVVNSSDEIEEFSETPKPSSSKLPAPERLRKRMSDGSQLSGTSNIPQGRVRKLKTEIEAKSEPPFFKDLKKAGSKPSSKISLVSAMKGKGKSTGTTRTNNMSHNVVSHDKLATASTPYAQSFVFPLELLIWGSRKTELDKKDTQPYFWLCWNEEVRKLQVHRQPLDSKTLSKDTPLHSIGFSVLTDARVQISEVSDFHLLRFELPSDLHQDLSDDVQKEGLTFKFMSRHGNMTEWSTFASRLKTLLERKGKKAEILKASNASGCLESALRSAAASELKREDKRREPSEPESDSIEATDVGEDIVPVKKRKQPRPRPVNGGRDQDISKMLVPRRRSSRLLPEPTKPEKQVQKEEQEEPPANSDEIILVYPHFGQGAVNITNGDLRRLEPFEFLNDTLIEFGLKLWLNDLRETQPELADSVHVFSSFFFKKLASKSNKTPEEGHKSVRKWTAKVDIFKKKFIVVPINENIHWYLAIIYHPEHILEPAPPKPTLRSSKRVSNVVAANRQTRSQKAVENEVVNVSSAHDVSNENDILVKSPTTTTENNSQAEAEVEGLIVDTESDPKGSTHLDESQIVARLNPDKNLSISIENFVKGSTDGFSKPETGDDEMDVDSRLGVDLSKTGVAAEKMSVIADSCSESSEDREEEEIDELDEDDEPTYDTHNLTGRMLSYASVPPRTPWIHFDRDDSEELDERSEEGSLEYPDNEPSEDAVDQGNRGFPGDDMDVDTVEGKQDAEHQAGSTVSAASFYGEPDPSIRTYEERRRPSIDNGPTESSREVEVDELDMLAPQKQEHNERSDDVEVTDYPRTIIFCMDSLNGGHPKAMTRLSEYLQEEAKDKKGIANPSPAKTRKATMPIQPNHCDCGLYLLHFAQSFVADPQKYTAAILSTKRSSEENRRALWNIDQVSTMRERMKERILAESTAWKKQKAEKEQRELESRGATGTDSANQPIQAEQSDDEIEVSEVRHVGSSPIQPIRNQAAARLR
ncbi:hypothetical protein ACEPAG_1627 [Sanghuangporus baumii]